MSKIVSDPGIPNGVFTNDPALKVRKLDDNTLEISGTAQAPQMGTPAQASATVDAFVMGPSGPAKDCVAFLKPGESAQQVALDLSAAIQKGVHAQTYVERVDAQTYRVSLEANKVVDTGQIIHGTSRSADFWYSPPSNDSGLYRYLMTLQIDKSVKLPPGFDPNTARPFVWASDDDGNWAPHRPDPEGSLSPDNGPLLWMAQFDPAGEGPNMEISLKAAQSKGLAFGVDVPDKSSGTWKRYWFQGPEQNTRLTIQDPEDAP